MRKPKAVSLLEALWIHTQMGWRGSLYSRMILGRFSSVWFHAIHTDKRARKDYYATTIMHGMITPKTCHANGPDIWVECLARIRSDWYYCWHLKGKCPWRKEV